MHYWRLARHANAKHDSCWWGLSVFLQHKKETTVQRLLQPHDPNSSQSLIQKQSDPGQVAELHLVPSWNLCFIRSSCFMTSLTGLTETSSSSWWSCHRAIQYRFSSVVKACTNHLITSMFLWLISYSQCKSFFTVRDVAIVRNTVTYPTASYAYTSFVIYFLLMIKTCCIFQMIYFVKCLISFNAALLLDAHVLQLNSSVLLLY